MKNVAKCDTWCELQNPMNHRVFEHEVAPQAFWRGHVCLIDRGVLTCGGEFNSRHIVRRSVQKKALDDPKSSTRPQSGEGPQRRTGPKFPGKGCQRG
ncbi:unnamed protein product [Brassica napus]|uniref:(rape) hypothetical protein n=1 Tax=Brassica napus TaxID=3708 RepID=A0A816P2B1_BRANA|nr:unnamed protein product [Brassica napus]